MKTHLTCGDCLFSRPSAGNIGKLNCHANPPTLIVTPQGPGYIRPVVDPDDMHCRHFHTNGVLKESNR